LKTIATGGLSHLVAEQSEHIDIIDPTLILDGLALISEKLVTY
jgi:type III pantothenate kinase